MREMGPFTWVMAWVVWLASQSTVPVVRMVVCQTLVPTVTTLRCAICSAATVKSPACTGLACSAAAPGAFPFPQAHSKIASPSSAAAGKRRGINKYIVGIELQPLLFIPGFGKSKSQPRAVSGAGPQGCCEGIKLEGLGKNGRLDERHAWLRIPVGTPARRRARPGPEAHR